MTRLRCLSASIVFVICAQLAVRDSHAFPISVSNNANQVIGHGDFVTGYDAADAVMGAEPVSASRMFVPSGAAIDGANERLFVADTHNHRILVFDLSSGPVNDMSADFVLGQPDFTTGGADPANPFGNVNTANPAFGCETGVNACGMRRSLAVAHDPGRDYLFGADPDNHRVLVWNLSAGITNGMPASFAVGQRTFTNGGHDGACMGGTAGTTNACGMYAPTALAYDTVNNRLFVADRNNNRVLVFNLAGGVTTGPSASGVLGQPSFTTKTANTACGGGSAGTPNACGMSSPDGLAYDAAGRRLFVSETGSHRILVFDLSSGIVNGMAATRVLGQPNFDTATANTSCGGGGSGNTNVNACGLGLFDTQLAYNDADDLLFASDVGNHRVLVFDTAAITSGEAATDVLGQPDFVTGYDPADPAFGGITSRSTHVAQLGAVYDSIRDELFVVDGGNHRIMAYGANVNGTPVLVEGEDESYASYENPDGSSTIEITDIRGDVYEVTLPPGTTAPPGSDITLTVDNPTDKDVPRIQVDAILPPGTFKTVTLPTGNKKRICIKDQAHAAFSDIKEKKCDFDEVGVPGKNKCKSFTATGDLGDNPDDPNDPLGKHVVQICQSATGASITLSGLRHTVIELMPDAPGPELTRTGGGEDEVGGCAATGGAAGTPWLIAALFVAMWLRQRRRG